MNLPTNDNEPSPAQKQQAAENMKEIMDLLIMLRMKHKVVNVSWAGEKFVIVGTVMQDGRYNMMQMKLEGLGGHIIVPPRALKLKPMDGKDG